MRNGEIVNARIRATHLGFEDHGIFTYWLQMEFGGYNQAFGGRFIPSNEYLRDAIGRILRIAGVLAWEQLVGCHVRVRNEGQHLVAIGHILEDEWYEPRLDERK